MDWDSVEGRAELWRAYPKGYLVGRGLRTVGGWNCLGSEGADKGGAWYRLGAFGDAKTQKPTGNLSGTYQSAALIWYKHTGAFGNSSTGFFDARDAGDLLPLPDSRDTANWAILLADLAHTVCQNWDADEPEPPGPAFLVQYESGDDWMLYIAHGDGSTSSFIVLPSGVTEDIEEALVKARIRLRAEEK